MIKIDKGMTMPILNRGPKIKYPWAQLQIGESFLSCFTKQGSIARPRAIAQLRTGFVFAVHQDEKTKFLRVWRMA